MKRLLISALCASGALSAVAADFFSTERCDKLLTLGARIGVNTSNRTLGNDAFPDCYHHESWGTGFDIGVTADLNIRDYIAIQPGFFFEHRTGHYTLMGSGNGSGIAWDENEVMSQTGKRKSFNFTIPVLAVIRFNVTDDLRWNVEAGPYVAFVLDSSLKNKNFVTTANAEHPLFSQKAASVDFGFKMGTSLRILNHYTIGAHYMAGCVPAWKDLQIGNVTKTFGGVTKAWVFSIGYDF